MCTVIVGWIQKRICYTLNIISILFYIKHFEILLSIWAKRKFILLKDWSSRRKTSSLSERIVRRAGKQFPTIKSSSAPKKDNFGELNLCPLPRIASSEYERIVNDGETKIHSVERLNTPMDDNFGVSKDFPPRWKRNTDYERIFHHGGN